MNPKHYDYFKAYLESFTTTYDANEIAEAEYAEALAEDAKDEDYMNGRMQ